MESSLIIKGSATNLVSISVTSLAVNTGFLASFAANTFNIGADLGAMAKGVQLIFPSWDFAFIMVVFTLTILLLQVYTTYSRYSKYLKYLALVLLAYVFTAFVIPMNWSTILSSSIFPSFSMSKEAVIIVCAVLGTTISPYLFFWQTSQEVEEEILAGQTTIQLRQGASQSEVKKMRVDIWTGMFASNLVMFFIIAVCAATLFSHGITNITSAADAAKALRPLAGDGAYFLFAIGIIGTGMLAIPVLAGSTSYAVSESFGWKEGLYKKLKQARAFYGVIIISMILGFILNFSGIDPIQALIYSALANGIVSPLVLSFIVCISSNKKIMGEHVNKKSTTILGWSIVVIMILVGGSAIVALA